MFNDLREFIDQVDKMGECKVIENADWNLEIGHITELATTHPDPPLLVFDNIKGYPPGYRIVTNVLTTEKRLALVLGLPPDLKSIDLVKAWREKIREGFKPVPPVEVETGPIKENILVGDEVDILKFPVPMWHDLDGGRFIGTGDLWIQKDPDTGWVNFGTYRSQVFDKSTAGFHSLDSHHGAYIAKKYWDRGQGCPAALVCGEDPRLLNASLTDVPYQVSEYDYTGWLRSRPIEVVRGETVDLPIPATAELVLEGEIVPETRMEGPFGEWEGYYGGDVLPDPEFRVKAILHRDNPIILGCPPLVERYGYFSGDHIRKSAQLWDELDKNVPGVKGVWEAPAGRPSLVVIVSLRQEYPGHAKQAALLVNALYKGAAVINRLTVIVDDDIDPSDISEVLWAIATRWDPATQTDIINGLPSQRSDPRLDPDKRDIRDYTGSRACIYACKPFSWIDRFPSSLKSSPEVLKKVEEKWGKFLFGKA
jgi:UbiD family decarboxylase